MAVLRSRDAAAMERLAGDWHTAPEVLFVLSQAPSVVTRARVAANPSTPDVVDGMLLNDEAAAVRAELGRKIAATLPELRGTEHARLRDAAAAKLLVLARDAEVIVRRALSAAVARLDCVPKELVTTLLRDVDALVAVPIAEFSPLLDEEDLIALIAEPPSPLALAAITRREGLTPAIVDRLMDTGDSGLMFALLRNMTTQLRESALDRIVDHARDVEELHAPLVDRPELTERLIVKLSSFVAAALVERLSHRAGLSADVRRWLEERARASGRVELSEMPTEEDILGAARRHAEGPIIAGLTMRAGISARAVRRIFAMRMAKAVLALCWKAQLSMEAAVALQAFPARIPPPRRLAATPDGGYPIPPEELAWHLSALGIDNPQGEDEVAAQRGSV